MAGQLGALMTKVLQRSLIALVALLFLWSDADAQHSKADVLTRLNPKATRVALDYARIVDARLRATIPQLQAESVRLGWHASEMTIVFLIGKDGQVQSVRIVVSSGNRRLDQRVASLLKSIRFPPPPEGADPDIRLPLRFKQSSKLP